MNPIGAQSVLSEISEARAKGSSTRGIPRRTRGAMEAIMSFIVMAVTGGRLRSTTRQWDASGLAAKMTLRSSGAQPGEERLPIMAKMAHRKQSRSSPTFLAPRSQPWERDQSSRHRPAGLLPIGMADGRGRHAFGVGQPRERHEEGMENFVAGAGALVSKRRRSPTAGVQERMHVERRQIVRERRQRTASADCR